jgi:hypothetical protein
MPDLLTQSASVARMANALLFVSVLSTPAPGLAAGKCGAKLVEAFSKSIPLQSGRPGLRRVASENVPGKRSDEERDHD